MTKRKGARKWLVGLSLPQRIEVWKTRSIITEKGCWLWTGSKCKGHGKVWFAGKLHGVHRLVYEYVKGPVREGLELDHTCKMRACWNPAHVEPVTHKVNLERGTSANREKKHCPRGHAYDNSNTRVNARGSRCCITCARDRSRQQKIALKALRHEVEAATTQQEGGIQ